MRIKRDDVHMRLILRKRSVDANYDYLHLTSLRFRYVGRKSYFLCHGVVGESQIILRGKGLYSMLPGPDTDSGGKFHGGFAHLEL